MPQAKKPKKSAKSAAKRPAKRPVRESAKKAAKPRRPPSQRAAGLTFQDRLFVKEYTQNGGNGTLAIIAAGIATDENVAANAASRLLNNAKIRESIEHCFSVAGLSERDVVQGFLEGFRAFKVTWVEDPKDTINGGYRALMTPDFAVRQKNQDMYFKIVGKYAPLKMSVENDMGQVLQYLFNREDEKPLAPKMIELTEGDDGFDVPDGGSNGAPSR